MNDSCGTKVPGLYAAGDAASREFLAGLASGGGGPNAAWAISTGQWAGEGAAMFAKSLGAHANQRVARPTGQAGLRSHSPTSSSLLINCANCRAPIKVNLNVLFWDKIY